jgi:hypothetical protein
VSTLTITKLALPGAHVKRGDLLVEFDRQVQTRDFMDIVEISFNNFGQAGICEALEMDTTFLEAIE